MPEGELPTRNFLGYEPLQALHSDARDAISNCDFETGESTAARLRYNPILFARVSNKLKSLDRRFKMVNYSRKESDKRRHFKFKTQPANLLFIRAAEDQLSLGSRIIRIFSAYQYGTNVSGAAGILTMHRERTEEAPGVCFTFNGAAAPNWVDTRDANFVMADPFLPTRGDDFPRIRDVIYQSATPEGVRTNPVLAFIQRNYLIKA